MTRANVALVIRRTPKHDASVRTAQLLVVPFLAGCASPVTPQPTSSVARHEATATLPSASAPADVPVPPSSASASASVLPDPDPAPALGPATSLVDAAKLQGYVMSRQSSSGIPDRFEARVTAVDTKDINDTLVEWWVSLQDQGGATHGVGIYAPKTLPRALVRGDRVRVTVAGTGGGPNRRLHLIFEAVDGSLLLGVNRAPDAWKVTRGKVEGTQAANGYDETRYGVVFEVAGATAKVGGSSWTRLQVGGITYYLWGSAAERKLHAGKQPMPDYVGGWLDFAIVRAR